MNVEVYDIETLFNCFTYTGYNTKEDKWYQFVIHDSINQLGELYEHITNDLIMMVGYNNEAFDYPVIHYIITNCSMLIQLSPGLIAERIYKEAQRIIEEDKSFIPFKDRIVPQTDLYKIWHYNSDAKRTSLKDLEFALNMENIEEIPLHHRTYIKEKDIPMILEYNKNDVIATHKFLLTTLGQTEYPIYKGKNKIELRQNLKKRFRISCDNYSDIKLGEQLMLNLYCRATKTKQKDIRELRTRRDYVDLKDCIPSWCNIKSKEFKEFYETIVKTRVKTDKAEFDKSIIFHEFKFDFGLGGAHGCCKSGVYKSNENNIILDLDVSSLYPSIASSLKLHPAHLDPVFTELYSKFIIDRINEKHKPKEERNEVLIEGYKLILNSVYGKSGENKSFLYDLLYKFRTTIGGQIFICMWCERIVEAVPELKFLQVNTDGLTILLPKNKVSLIKDVCNKLTEETGLIIEEAFYKKMVILDVNDYIAEYEDSTSEKEHLKLKGCFEINKEYHKDNSMKIVPIALKEYFINNIPIEDTIRNHKDIFDFCIRLKVNSSSKAKYNWLNKDTIETKELGRTTRYYISNKGGALNVNYNRSNKATRVSAGYVCTLFNHYEKKDDYNINYKFYINEAMKIYNSIIDPQMSLF